MNAANPLVQRVDDVVVLGFPLRDLDVDGLLDGRDLLGAHACEFGVGPGPRGDAARELLADLFDARRPRLRTEFLDGRSFRSRLFSGVTGHRRARPAPP